MAAQVLAVRADFGFGGSPTTARHANVSDTCWQKKTVIEGMVA